MWNGGGRQSFVKAAMSHKRPGAATALLSFISRNRRAICVAFALAVLLFFSTVLLPCLGVHTVTRTTTTTIVTTTTTTSLLLPDTPPPPNDDLMGTTTTEVVSSLGKTPPLLLPNSFVQDEVTPLCLTKTNGPTKVRATTQPRSTCYSSPHRTNPICVLCHKLFFSKPNRRDSG